LEKALSVTVDEAILARTAPVDAGPPPLSRRPPPKAIAVLLPVWGDEFIEQFLEQSLPTLLAPGNVPALAKALPTRFVFLCRARDEAIIRAHSAYRRLRQVVAVEFLPIDDLITSSNHSTTITLAYARAVRQTGAAMTDTCFFFLVSDYIMADGSLAAVLARMQAGVSAVQVGNFQLEEQTARPWLRERLASADGTLALSPREVMRWALGCLHPITAANTINFPLSHNIEANRLLWRVDRETLIGRFYLLHMICIRPETVDFVVGSSCDYSFVPEMCPSGNHEIVTDSDEYLVVEIQPASHEIHFLRLGPAPPDVLAKSLSQWTTSGHRANARQAIVFHAAEPPASLPAALAEADAFMRDLSPRLSPRPQPHRNHPYWRGAIAAFDAAVAERESGIAGTLEPVAGRTIRRTLRRVFGRAPDVTRAHPRWKDFRRPLAACRTLAANPTRLLIGAGRSTPSTEWLRREAPSAVFVPLHRLLLGGRIKLDLAGFDVAFIDLIDGDVAEASEVLRVISEAMRPGGEIIVAATNGNWFTDPENFGRMFARGFGSLARSGLWPVEFQVVTTSRFRWRLNAATISNARGLIERRTALFPLHLVAAALRLPYMIGVNFISSYLSDRPPAGRIASSAFIRLRVAELSQLDPG
jgi:hypothetical protein